MMKDNSDSKGELDVTMVASFVDRWAEIVRNLVESTAELHQRVNVLSEKE